MPRVYQLYGSVLSPFSVKVRVMCDHAGLRYRWLPEDASTAENVRVQARLFALKRGWLRLTYPRLTDLDELPLVPFLFGPDGTSYYDSTAIGHWIDSPASPCARSGLIPDDPLARFVCHLVDEYVDEFGLYLLHHGRWVTSAATTRAPDAIGREFRSLVPSLVRPAVVRRFAARQVRRLPYLFSVAPDDAPASRALPADRRPPARDGFPPTHHLLDAAFERELRSLEAILTRQAFVLGDRFTLADASLFGQLGSIDQLDPEAARSMPPGVAAWVRRMLDGGHRHSDARAPVAVDEPLAPLLQEIGGTFVPLMVHNEQAYERERARGQRLFNEAAFDRNVSLYDGELQGERFRSVVKTFQVRVWRALRAEWDGLPARLRARLLDLAPELALLGG